MEEPAPIWRTRARGERPSFSETAVVEAALQLLDESGLPSVTMRQVADRMGVTTPTLYWYVQNKDGLLERLYDRLCSEVAIPAQGSWQEQLRSLAWAIRATFSKHRGGVALAVGRFPLGPHGLRVTESAMAALASAGLDDEAVANGAYLFFNYVTSFANQESVLPASTPVGERLDALRRVEQYLSALPAARFPHLTRYAGLLSRPGLDERFRFGLDQIIGGLERLAVN